MHIQYLCGLVRHSPDAYLDEMQALLEERRGVEVHRSTVWRALTQSGFTMKKVCQFTLLVWILVKGSWITISLHGMLLNEMSTKGPFFVTNMVASILQNRLSLSTRAHLIVEHVFVEKPGQFQVNEQSEMLSLFVGAGNVQPLDLFSLSIIYLVC